MPRLEVKVVGRNLVNRCENNSPTQIRGDHYIYSCLRDEVSYAFHFQEEDITPLN